MRITATLLIIFCFIIQSCQKEPDVTLDDDPVLPEEEPTLFVRYVELDTTLMAPNDTLDQEYYHYDENGRIKKIIGYSYELGNVVDFEEQEYFYNANDTLPWKIFSKWTEVGGDTYTYSTFYEYENGRLTYDSTLEFRQPANEHFSTTAKRYTRNGDNVSILRKDYSLPDLNIVQSEYSATMLNTVQNGNIILQEAEGDIIFSWYPFIAATYDDKINPFFDVYPPAAFFDKWALQKNNTVSLEMGDDLATPQIIEQTTYDYRPDGRPSVARIHDPSSIYSRKALYFYSN